MPLFAPVISPSFAEGVKLIFSTSVSLGDPGSGMLALDAATQNLSTNAYISTLDVNGVDITSHLDAFDDSTNPSVKGSVRLTNFLDPTEWLEGLVTAVISAAGYRQITLDFTASSTASPFNNGDTLVFSFTRAGDVVGTGASKYVPVHDERLYHEQQLTNNKLDQIIEFLLLNQ
jgi:hypothetical protein